MRCWVSSNIVLDRETVRNNFHLDWSRDFEFLGCSWRLRRKQIEMTSADKLSSRAQSGNSLGCTSFSLAGALAGLHIACNANSWSRTPRTRVLQCSGSDCTSDPTRSIKHLCMACARCISALMQPLCASQPRRAESTVPVASQPMYGCL